jgi:protein-arginine kinase activator protein McsA
MRCSECHSATLTLRIVGAHRYRWCQACHACAPAGPAAFEAPYDVAFA